VTVVSRLDATPWSVLGIDMPIGLPEDGARACDVEARRFISPRGSCVFPAPPRVCLGARGHAVATLAAVRRTGTGISRQAFHLLPKIAEVDALVRAAAPGTIVEVHPECSFTMLHGGVPLPPKRTAAGALGRRALLEPIFGPLPARPPRGAALDDVLDAYAVLWTVERVAAGTARTFGDGAVDACGITMQIVT
jgi:predicted RNase H-like nuclease